MIKIITAFTFFICSIVTAQTQYEQGMAKGLGLWKDGKTTEAVATFERIASVEKTNWLPNYYVSFISTLEAFGTKDREKVSALLGKSQLALDDAFAVSEKNPELMVLQSLIYTAWIVYDPMTNGMKYSYKTMQEYNKALAIDPKNPRVVLSKAEFEIGGAKYWGSDTKPMCAEVAKSIELFANFKPETPFSPNWGLDRAQEILKDCK